MRRGRKATGLKEEMQIAGLPGVTAVTADLIVNMGGNRYGWFTFVDVPGGVAIDNTQVVPLPSTMLLLGSGLAGLAFYRKRRAVLKG